jgi:hypothetical protein
MEAKWIAILAIGMSACMFIPLSVVEYKRMECKIEAVKQDVTPEVATKLCR